MKIIDRDIFPFLASFLFSSRANLSRGGATCGLGLAMDPRSKGSSFVIYMVKKQIKQKKTNKYD